MYDASLTVAAALVDVTPEEMPALHPEEKRRKRRQAWTVTLTSILLFSVASSRSLKNNVALNEIQWNYSEWMLSADRRLPSSRPEFQSVHDRQAVANVTLVTCVTVPPTDKFGDEPFPRAIPSPLTLRCGGKI